MLAACTLIISCSKDNNNSDNFDAAKQALLDDETLIEYLKTHYLKENGGGIDTITNGETSLMVDNRLGVKDVKHNEIDYKLYYLILNEGVGVKASRFDSVVVNLSGIKLDSTIFQNQSNNTIFDLTNILYGDGAAGFAYSVEELRAGEIIINDDESFYFENSGEGIFFLPSGLGYRNLGSFNAGIEANEPLIFKIALNSLNEADHDNDGILTKNEDLDNDGDVKNDDTDGDLIMNYLDVDDDNDGKLTKDEDTNGNGNWFDDDTDNDGIPNFLDKDN